MLPLPSMPSIAVLPFANLSGRSTAGILQRRHYGRSNYLFVPCARTLRYRAHLNFHLQGKG